MDYADLTRRMRERTAPSSAAIARVRSRLDQALVPATRELSHLPHVSPAAVARVKARLAQPQRRPVPIWLGAGLAFASAGTVLAGWWSLHGEPAHADLAITGTGTEQVDRVALTHDGEGHAVLDGDRIQVDWEYGRLGLDGPADLTLAVVTPEGSVEAAGGAALVVVRDASGTRIEVGQGSAAVRCGAAPVARRSGTVACDPVTATGWLTRARSHDGTAAAEDVLADVDHGLLLPDAVAAVRSELLTLRTNTLLAAGRNADALGAAEAALAVTTDPARSQELHRTAAHLALMAQDCDRALPHLAALSSLTDDERAYQERCSNR